MILLPFLDRDKLHGKYDYPETYHPTLALMTLLLAHLTLLASRINARQHTSNIVVLEVNATQPFSELARPGELICVGKSKSSFFHIS